MSHSGSSQLHGDPSSELEPMQPEASQDMGYPPDYDPLPSSPVQLTDAPHRDAIDYPEESSDDDLILVKVTKEVVPVTKKLVRTMSERDSDSEDADEWLKATDDEIQSLNENETWDLVDMPSGRKPIGTKWVFKRKYKSDGSLDRYKARLVCTGYSQKYGIDY
jgi:hypothetical protein